MSNHDLMLHDFFQALHIRPDTDDQYLGEVIVGLLSRYFDRVPVAKAIFSLIKERGDRVVNDHIAFRSLDIRSLLDVFLPYGYQVKFADDHSQIPFNFKAKRLTAVWLKHPNSSMPRIFVSECRVDELPKLKSLIEPYIGAGVTHKVPNINQSQQVVDYLHTGKWHVPTYKDYQLMQAESEYVAWVLYNRYYLNHFTLTVNQLDSFGFQAEQLSLIQQYQTAYERVGLDAIQSSFLSDLVDLYQQHMIRFNQFLLENGVVLNEPHGNPLNISQDGLLLQSSSKSERVLAKFPDGSYEIPGSYIEFAYRGILPEMAVAVLKKERTFLSLNGSDLRDGFEVGNADKIFESTYLHQAPELLDEPIVSDAFNQSRDRLRSYLDSTR